MPWPGGESSPKAADPPTRDPGDQEAPALPLPPHPGPAAAHPHPSIRSGAEAGQDVATPAGLDARYEQLRHAVLHDRAGAFPLGLGVLIARGVTAWRRLLTGITATPTPPATTTTAAAAEMVPTAQDTPRPAPASPAPSRQPVPPPMPAQLTSQLVHALADLAVTLAGA